MSLLKIIRIPILPFGMINAHLIVDGQNCVLVDTGLPNSEAKIEKALNRQGLSFRDIKLIVVTHAHVDHAGSAARIRDLSGAPILAHEGDLKYYRQEVPMAFCSTGWFGNVFLRTGLILEPYTPFEPDILLSGNETTDLGKFGIRWSVKHSAGHTDGSLSVELDSRDAMVGDLLASGILLGGIVRTRHAIRPPFEDDPHIVAGELQRLVDRGMERFYMGHGGPVSSDEVRRHANMLMALPKSRRLQEN